MPANFRFINTVGKRVANRQSHLNMAPSKAFSVLAVISLKSLNCIPAIDDNGLACCPGAGLGS